MQANSSVHFFEKSKAPILILLCLAGFLFFFRLGERSFRNPDEGRYAEVAREMVVGGDWTEPRLYGVDYLRKPILFYWFLAASFSVFGFSEWAARIVPAFFGLLGVLATYLFTKKILGGKTAFLASLILTTNFWYLNVGRYLLIDIVFSFFVMGGLYAFYMAISNHSHRRTSYFIAYIFFSLAFLCKGVAGIALPAISILSYMIVVGRLKELFSLKKILTALFVFLVIALPWYIQIAVREPEFLSFFFFHEHIARFTATHFEHQKPWFYYLVITPIAFLPWVFFIEPWSFVIQKNRGTTDEKKALLFAFVSAAAMLLFYSLSRSKLPTYIVPIIPFIAILLGEGWKRWVENGLGVARHTFSRWALVVLLFLSCSVLIGAESFIEFFLHRYHEKTTLYAQIIAGIITAGCVVGLRSLRAKNLWRFFYSIVGMLTLVGCVVVYTMEAVNSPYTTKSFAKVLKPRLKEGDKVFIYGAPGAFYDFAFYLNTPVKLVGLEGELEFSREEKAGEGEDVSEETGERLAWVSPDEFLDFLKRGEPLYGLIRRSDFDGFSEDIRSRLKILSEDKRKVLFESTPSK